MSTSFRSQIHVKQVGSFERESSAGVERALSRCAIVDSERLGYCCDQPGKRCQELPEIDCEGALEGALCKRQALALLRSERKTSDHLAAQSHGHVAQRADGAAQRECVGHRPRTRTAPVVAVALRRDGTRAGERHDGDWYHLFMSGKTIPNVPGTLHPREPETYAVAVHEDGLTKMAAFKIPGPTATPVFMGRTHSSSRISRSAWLSIRCCCVPSGCGP